MSLAHYQLNNTQYAPFYLLLFLLFLIFFVLYIFLIFLFFQISLLFYFYNIPLFSNPYFDIHYLDLVLKHLLHHLSFQKFLKSLFFVLFLNLLYYSLLILFVLQHQNVLFVLLLKLSFRVFSTISSKTFKYLVPFLPYLFNVYDIYSINGYLISFNITLLKLCVFSLYSL